MLTFHCFAPPKWRARRPVERAMLAGDERDRCQQVMTLETELDTGPVHLEKEVRYRRPKDGRDAAR